MRIGFIVVKHALLGGGIETYTYEVGRRLVSMGHEVTVFSMDHYGPMEAELEGMTIVKVPSISGSSTERLTASIAGVFSALRASPRFDILHLHTPMTGAFGIVPYLLGYATVVQMHGIDWKRERWGSTASSIIRAMESFVLHSLPVCTAVSETLSAHYAAEYDRTVVTIPTGTEPACIDTQTDKIEELGLAPQRYVLFMARHVPEKGAHLLIEAFRRLDTDYKLVVAGDIPKRTEHSAHLRTLAEGDDRIIFPGFVHGRQKNQLLSHAGVFAQPSTIEGLSIGLLEAMSFGIPCLISDIPENLEALGAAGYTFRSEDTQSLTASLRTIIDSPEQARTLGRQAQNRVLENFSWDHVCAQLLELYEASLQEAKNSTFAGRLRLALEGHSNPSKR